MGIAMAHNPYESPATVVPPRPARWVTWRLAIALLGTVVLVAAAITLSVLAMHFHGQYGAVHEAARRLGPSAGSPQVFYDRAGNASNAILAVCVVAFVFCIATKHPISVVGLLICIGLFLFTALHVGARY